MRTKTATLLDRVIKFAVDATLAARALRRDIVGDHPGRQLARCATSVGANYAEACEAESRADFVHKLKICLKEVRETEVWLRISAGVSPSRTLDRLTAESRETCCDLCREFSHRRTGEETKDGLTD